MDLFRAFSVRNRFFKILHPQPIGHCIQQRGISYWESGGRFLMTAAGQERPPRI